MKNSKEEAMISTSSSRTRRAVLLDLPMKLLQLISEFFGSDVDELSPCREGCTNWWSSNSMSALLPQLVGTRPQENLFSSSVFVIRSHGSGSTPWIVSVVEITKGKIELLHPFLGTPLSDVPDGLDLSRFQPCRLATAYHMAHVKHEDCSSALCCYTKVLLFSKHSLPEFDHCSQLVLDGQGNLGGYPPFHSWYKEEGEGRNQYVPWLDVIHNSVDDIEAFKGSVHILDQYGRLYQMSNIVFGGLKRIVDGLVCKAEWSDLRWRKSLVVSSSGEKLYLILRANEVLKVYELSAQSDMSWQWIEVQRFGEDNQVLFMSRLYCYFASAKEFPSCNLSNCIIFTHEAFPVYSKSGWKFRHQIISEEQIQIFRLGGQDGNTFKSIIFYPDFPISLWTTPSWVLQTSTSSFHSRYDRNTEESKEVISGMNCPYGAFPSSFVPRLSKSVAATPKVVARAPMTEEERTDREEAVIDWLFDHHVSGDFPNSHTQVNKTEDLTAKFEELQISSDLLPTLQKIWSKHGNIMESSIIRNNDIVATALESLATAVLIFEQNSVQTLTDSEADYLSSTLSDLRCMHIKVDWLSPCVEKALRLHECKPLLGLLNKLNGCKDQTVKKLIMLQLELSVLDSRLMILDEKIANITMKIPFSGDVDLDKPLKDGLF